MNNKSVYRCISCGSNDLYENNSLYICNKCDYRYPLIEGIPIFVSNPDSALSAYTIDLNTTKKRLSNIINIEKSFTVNEPTPQSVERTKTILTGATENIQFIEQEFDSILAYLNNKNIDADFISWASTQTGLSFHGMLIYFYLDWYGNKEFKEVEEFFCNSIEKYSGNRDSAAVLGAAACGLLHSISHHFEDSYGVDLALPALLTAKKLISGNPMTFSLEKARWKRINITPPAHPGKNIHFAVANVMNLPFADNSLSTITTQCLLNLVGDPMAFAGEIRRVLKPDGIWINFSHPTRLNDDVPQHGGRTLDEFVNLLESYGFKSLSTEIKRFKFLNTERIDPSADVIESDIWCFTLKNTTQLIAEFSSNRIRKSFTSNPENLWLEIPRIINRKRPTISYEKAFSSNEKTDTSVLTVMGHSFNIPKAYAHCLENILTHIDGKKNVREIYEKLAPEELTLTETDYLRLMHCLSVDNYLIDFM